MTPETGKPSVPANAAGSGGSTTPEESTIVSAPAPPRADCIADSAGGLTFDLDAPGPGLDLSEPDHWTAALVLRRRGSDDEAEEIRLPLAPDGAGRLRAVLPSTVALPEGRWDVYVAFADAAPRRLVPGLADLRSLVDRRPGPSTSPLAVRIPYATKHGNLSLRSWLRGPHAEAGDLHPDASGLTAHGRIHRVADPAAWLSGAVVEARCRRAPDLVVTAPVTTEKQAEDAPAEEADGQDFSFSLEYARLAEEWHGGLDVWDLWLRPADGSEPARIARLLDDVVDKQQIFTYPVLPVDAAYAPAQAGPYYTADNDLAVRIEERPPVAG
ncbi:hypothetical protein V7793_30315 [Streptomyces sp. KLMMK]|uniref:hypothetical protein n=1 Tax=Streptomyces sp. KLMMK TaxID=3109353 RepID=UPI00300A7A36